jgi:hypothetical protein
MPKRNFLLLALPTLPGINLPGINLPGINLLPDNLLSDNLPPVNLPPVTLLPITLLAITLLAASLLTSQPALADDDKDQTGGSTSIYRGLSGQRVPASAFNLPLTNGLPATNLDSFVFQAGAMADQIYGDESIQGQPEFNDGFAANHRINAGITGVNDAGLTTGHGSVMPSAWGADEFIAPPGEWCQSGPGGFDIPTRSGALGQMAGAVVNAVFSEMPSALGSLGASDATGLGRVIGLPNAASIALMPIMPGVPALPPAPFVPALPGVSGVQGMPIIGVPGGPGHSPMSSLANPFYSAASAPSPQLAFSNGINITDLSSGVGGF